jgi:hypothetical protein
MGNRRGKVLYRRKTRGKREVRIYVCEKRWEDRRKKERGRGEEV